MCLVSAFALGDASAQFGPGYGRPGYGYGRTPAQRYPQRRRQQDNQPAFRPTVQLSIGYGYPSSDKEQMAQFRGLYRGTVAQTGPVTGALDVQFSRSSAIGLIVSHGEVSAPYYDYNSGSPAVYGRLSSWTAMLNLMHYMPVPASAVFSPYVRTAIGLNIWNQNYTDATGNKLGYVEEPNQLAYQVGIGTNINFSRNTSLFVEAGYGKFLLHGGLAFKL